MSNLAVKLSVILAIPIVAVSYTNCANYSMQNYELSAEGLKQGLAVGGLIINDDAAYTKDKEVTLRLIHENADEMYITDDSSCEAGGVWEDYSPIKAWTLRNADGNVYARYRPKKTPDFVSPCFQDGIKMDTTLPVAYIDRSRNLGEFINANPVYLEVKSSDGESGVASIECKSSAGFTSACQTGVTLHTLAEGSHNIQVVVIDKAGNRSVQVIDSFLVDRKPPSLSIHSAPTGTLGSGNATFEFSANDNGGSGVDRFQCARGSSSFSDCSSPFKITNASGSDNRFRIRAIDKAGNKSNESSHTWSVDTSVPTLSITSKPPAKSNSSIATFEFVGSDSGGSVRFECSFEGATFSACSSGIQYSGLASGSYSFTVRAIDNVGLQANQPYEWVVDRDKPTVSIASGPTGRTKDTSAAFTFSVSDTGTGIKETFCSIDGAAYESCAGGYTIANVSEGNHRFNVMTRDNAGNDSAVAERVWSVDLTRPTVQITQGPADPSLINSISFGFSGTDANSGTISGYMCSLDSQAEVSCNSPAAFQDLSDGPHVVSVKAIDSVGLVSDTVAASFKVDANAPSISLMRTPAEVISTATTASLEYRIEDASEITSIRCGFEGALDTCAAAAVIDVTRTSVGTYKFVIEAIDIHGKTSTIDKVWRVEQATRPVDQPFQTTLTNMVDVIVIIDNSGSMDSERANVGSRFGSFLDKLEGAGLDWRVGVMSTAVYCGSSCATNPASVSTPTGKYGDGYLRDFNGYSGKYILDRSVGLTQAKASFQRTIEGDLGWVSGDEQGIAQSWNLVNRTQSTWTDTATNRAKNFFRDGASLSVIIVSDADESPVNNTRTWNNPDELIKIVKVKWPSKSFSFHSIIVVPNDEACKNAQGGAEDFPYGTTYQQLSQKTGGIVGSVCATDYATQLGTMGQASLDQIRSVNLSCAPLDTDSDGQPDIKVDGVKIAAPVLSGLKLTLPNTPAIGSHNLEYTCLN
jgi:hypothetical protein